MTTIHPAVKKILVLSLIVVGLNLLLFRTDFCKNLKFVGKFIQGDQHADSWTPMSKALTYFKEQYPQHGLMYDKIFFQDKTKFQYAPTSLLPSYVLSKRFEDPTKIFKIITWACIPITIIFLILIFQHTAGIKFSLQRDNLLTIACITALSLLYYPLVKAYSLGQIQAWINAMFSIIFYFWIKGNKPLPGFLLGLSCLIKPQYGLIALWGLIRKQKQFFFLFFVTFMAGLIASILIFGLANHLNYLSVLSYLSKHGEAFYPNQSMNGILNRLTFNGEPLIWQYHDFPPFNPIVYYGATFFSVVLILLALIVPKIKNQSGTAFDLAIVALTATMASPVAWEHHYGILLPVYVYLLADKEMKGRTFGWIAVSYLMTGAFIPAVNKLAFMPGFNILMSHLFIGAMILLLILYKKVSEVKGR